MSFELVGGVGLAKAIETGGALGAAGISLVNGLKQTDSYRLRRLTNRTAAATYARVNSPADFWIMPSRLTDLVQMYAKLSDLDRAALTAYVGGRAPVEVGSTGPTITFSRRREYDKRGRLRAEEDTVTITPSELAMGFTSPDPRGLAAGCRGSRANRGGGAGHRRSPDRLVE
jgi:hypothetical protein